ncbi:helix-turn-helix domain-containing protein [Croceivirga sp. JEA036]|uniref:helix-turn-helix domain-containing protein n=1 Tax=Croceivirga sp. JEA036 TaxID=2721162 RepID=UPI00143A71D9|nr:helix-turn-helix transcriptional regulator [Croceivirga sp. JEA036]NJB36354.1 helix-turn-helix transcriptional regulator [Croceivirga sp. JEA036]
MSDINYFAENLRYLLDKQGHSQQHLADIICKDRTSISAYLRRKSTPDFATIITISNLYSVSIDDLLKKDLKHAKYDLGEHKSIVREKNAHYKTQNFPDQMFTEGFEGYIKKLIKEGIKDYLGSAAAMTSLTEQISYLYKREQRREFEEELEKSKKRLKRKKEETN